MGVVEEGLWAAPDAQAGSQWMHEDLTPITLCIWGIHMCTCKYTSMYMCAQAGFLSITLHLTFQDRDSHWPGAFLLAELIGHQAPTVSPALVLQKCSTMPGFTMDAGNQTHVFILIWWVLCQLNLPSPTIYPYRTAFFTQNFRKTAPSDSCNPMHILLKGILHKQIR